MKWLVFACLLVCLVKFGEGGALKCIPGAQDAVCRTEQREEDLEVSVQETEAECLAGSEWESNCHYCRCSDTGVAECLKQDICGDGISTEPIRCKPNTTFERDCNSCTCLENGLGLCTMNFCPRSSIDKECAPGTTWSSQCNSCRCTSSGQATCTEKACSDNSEPLRKCAPESEWQNECHSCWCTDGGLPMCMRTACTATANLQLDDNSKNNVLHKIPEAVLRTSKNKSNSKIVCVANRMFIKDCNTCWCNEDGTSYFCTRRVCVPELPEENDGDEKPEELSTIKHQCRPDEVFEIDCNMCRCNSDGKSFSCTRRACVDQADEDKEVSVSRTRRALSQEPPKACQPGQEFRVDCNKCLCDNEGQDFSCTRIDCNAVNNNNGGTRRKRDVSKQVTTECVPTSLFDHGCNECRCTLDGHHAVCTLQRCGSQLQTNKNNGAESSNTDSESSFRCNPGEQFKRACNDCTCSADGKSVFCTLRLCDKDIALSV